MKVKLVKRENASELILTVLISAVFSLLGARLFLELTGYWQLGQGNWHIAHALWGGLIMTGGMCLELIFHGSKIKKVTAVIFGLGLGSFLDEIGKYLSKDNNYFFQPAIIFMYIIFIILFLVYRYLEKSTSKDKSTLLYQVINQLEDVAEDDIDLKEKDKMLFKLKMVAEDKSNQKTVELARKLIELVKSIPANKIDKEGFYHLVYQWGKRYFYNKIFRRKLVLNILLILAGLYIVTGVADSLFLLPRFRQNELFEWWFGGLDLLTKSSATLFGLKSLSDVITSVLFIFGIYWVIKRKKRRGINFFQYGLLVNIFLTSVFRFYFEQFSGVFGLAVSIVIYNGLSRLKREV
jgi:hypothetical protein